MNLIDTAQAAALLRTGENILIVTHVRPDGDAAGSACALCLGLRAMGKQVYLALNPPSMTRYEKYMTPYFAPDGFVPGLIVAVDTPSPRQFPPGLEALAEKTGLAIDHHGTNSGYGQSTLLDGAAAAAGEIVYTVLTELGVPISVDMAEALYTALATDTNGFRTAATTGRTLAMAGALHDRGFDVLALTRRLFETKSLPRLRLEAALFSSMELTADGVCVMSLPLETIRRCGASEDDMDKISVLTMVPEGACAGLLLRQLADETWKVSLRTDGQVNAGRVLAALGGGGHQDAAGAVLPGPPEALRKAVLDAFQANAGDKNQINI